MADPNEICRVCHEKRSAHVKTEKGEFTHPREARGEGYYKLAAAGTYGGGLEHDDQYWERYEFVDTRKEQNTAALAAQVDYTEVKS